MLSPHPPTQGHKVLWRLQNTYRGAAFLAFSMVRISYHSFLPNCHKYRVTIFSKHRLPGNHSTLRVLASHFSYGPVVVVNKESD